jgi:hypothetical protein
MDYHKNKELKLANLKNEMIEGNISVEKLAGLLNREASNVRNIFLGSKTFSEKFLYNAALAIRVHPDVINCTSKTVKKVLKDIKPHEIPAFVRPAARKRINKSKRAA